MAEAAVGFDFRRIGLIAGVVVVVVFSGLFFLYRSCSQLPGRKPGYVVIYSNLELKDAANAIARLKELNVQYEIRDGGRAIAVPKDKSDQAKLGLAEKNLPAGGVVGWEIFDESKLGATDFDRRIQLIRAISGELSRTIRRIEGVDDVRVQIVIPETKLFAATTAPVTASVLLHLRPGIQLTRDKINGIVYLVASSVENLQPENVTVVDDSGRILTTKITVPAVAAQVAPPPPAEQMVAVKPAAAPATTPETVSSKEVGGTSTTSSTSTTVASLSAEEKILIKVRNKKELEQELTSKAQELLNRFYPLNSVIVRVGVAIQPAKDKELQAQDLKIKKMYTIILVDNRVVMTTKLKKATFTTVAAATGYNKKRGDKIVLQAVPFHIATPAVPEKTLLTPEKKIAPLVRRSATLWSTKLFLAGGLFLLVIVLLGFGLIPMIRRQQRAKIVGQPSPAAKIPVASQPIRDKKNIIDRVKSAAEDNPERIAELLKKWLSE